MLVAARELDHLDVVADGAHLEQLAPEVTHLGGLGARDHAAHVPELAQQAHVDILGNRHGLEETLDLAVFGDVGNAVFHRLARHPVADGFAAQQHLAAMKEVALDQPRHHLEGFRAARPHQPEHSRDLAGKHRQRIVFHHGRHAQIAHRQHAFALLAHHGLALAVQGLRQVAPDHGLDDACAVKVGLVVGHHMLAVAQHGNAVGQQQRFFQRMRDKNDRDAARLEVEHQVKEVLLFFGRQAGGGLVKNDDAGVMQHGAGDFHHLLFGRAQEADAGGGVHVKVERLQKLLRRDVDAAQAVVKLLAAQKQVLCHRHGGHQAGFLEHHGNAVAARVQRRFHLNRFAFDQHLA